MGRIRPGEGEPKHGYGSMCRPKKHRMKHDGMRESRIGLIGGGIRVGQGSFMRRERKEAVPTHGKRESSEFLHVKGGGGEIEGECSLMRNRLRTDIEMIIEHISVETIKVLRSCVRWQCTQKVCHLRPDRVP